jgi:hypothetical protein
MCKKLQGKIGWTKMADLPQERTEPGPPFSFVRVDTFRPWPVVCYEENYSRSQDNIQVLGHSFYLSCIKSDAHRVVGDMSSVELLET